MYLKNKKLIVTGGAGFLGERVVEELKNYDVKDIFVPRSKDYNLVEKTDINRMYKDANADIVIHLAAVVGGIGANMKHPGSFFYENIMMGTQLIEQAKFNSIEKFVAIGTICAYPKFTPVPFKEENLWDGYPEETNAAYGLAKKMLLVQSQAYRQEYSFNSICLFPVNLYGPNDNFNPDTSHVIPALIKKCVDARNNYYKQISVWGDGSVSREFLYVKDAAKGIVLATEKYNKPDPINLGSGMEITIRDLVKKIKKFTGFKGETVWDITQPNGQPRRCLDISKAEKEFGFKATTDFEEGLKKTIDWYKLNGG